jgi:hypothetical protein
MNEYSVVMVYVSSILILQHEFLHNNDNNISITVNTLVLWSTKTKEVIQYKYEQCWII